MEPCFLEASSGAGLFHVETCGIAEPCLGGSLQREQTLVSGWPAEEQSLVVNSVVKPNVLDVGEKVSW